MDAILEACADLDYSWLPDIIGDFRLSIDKTVKGKEYLMFHYENDKGWRWQAVYDKEVEDYTVHVIMPLFDFYDINFIKTNPQEFWSVLQERMEKEIVGLLVEPQSRFTFAYKEKGLCDWDFSPYLPKELAGFVRDIDPSCGVRMINGSYIITEYKNVDDPSGLIIFYNVLRDEFFAELRCHNYPEISHDLDATSITDLENVLDTNLDTVLQDLRNRL